MPRGSAPGERRGGRKKGIPNKITTAARAAFLATFEKLEPELEDWIRQTANGWDEEVVIGRGENQRTAIVRQGKDPGKAAEILVRMAEYHFPKLGRHEVTGDEGGPLEFVIRDVTKEK